MSLLTTSQLTFSDIKDSYHVEITDCVLLSCDKDENLKEDTSVNISYSIYCGSTRVVGSASVDSNINGNAINAVITNCNENTDGSIKFSIAKGTNLKNTSSIKITLTEYNNDDEYDFTFTKYVQLIKVFDGTDGAGITFKVYSENGTVFREDMSEIELETVFFVGTDKPYISNNQYIWTYKDHSGKDVSKDGSTLTISKTDINLPITIKCSVTYNDVSYEDYITLTDEVIVYTSEVRYFNGSNVFGKKDKFLVAYMSLYKNGKEIDQLPVYQYARYPATIEHDIIETDVKKQDNSDYGADDVGELLYFVIITTDENNEKEYSAVLGEFNGQNWRVVNMEDVIDSPYECNYSHSIANDYTLNKTIQNKIMVLSKDQIDKTLNISFDAYKNDELIANAEGNVIDVNDPIVDGNEPENPVDGTIWIDPDTTVIKICKIKEDGTAEWVNYDQKVKNIYTSKPTSYSVGDIWVLNNGETCVYNKDGIDVVYESGSILRASQSRENDFVESDWLEVESITTQTRDNINQYFEFNTETGLKISQEDKKFYVNIGATEMGFYDNSNPDDPRKKVVSIGNQSATINNATLENGAEFNCNAEFNNQINMYNPYTPTRKGFVWKIESNGSLSLICSDSIQRTIRGTWADVFAAEDNNTYKQKYKIGDTLALDLGDEGVIDMQIAAFDADYLDSEGNNRAKITWVAKQLLKTPHRMSPSIGGNASTPYTYGEGAVGGWPMSEMREYLSNIIFNLIPTEVGNNIKDVFKYYNIYNRNGVLYNTTNQDKCKLWLPSIKEIGGVSGESYGPVYTDLFFDNDSRIKYPIGLTTAQNYWTRTCGDTVRTYRYINSNGDANNSIISGSTNRYILLGFCT